MKFYNFLCLAALLSGFLGPSVAYGQSATTSVLGYVELASTKTLTGSLPGAASFTPCPPDAIPVQISNCQAQLVNPDNNPGNELVYTWTISGVDPNQLFFTQVIQNGIVRDVIDSIGTDDPVFSFTDATASDDFSFRIRFNPNCYDLSTPTLTFRTWAVTDTDNDNRPDTIPGSPGQINGCFTECTLPVTLNCPSDPSTGIGASITDATCEGGDGSIILQLDRDRFLCDPVSVNWSGPGGFTASQPSIAFLDAGTYRVTVNDPYGCPARATFEVPANEILSLNCSEVGTITTLGAAEGSIQVDITDRDGPYTIAWSGPVSDSRTNQDTDLQLIENLPAGTYTITVTDSDQDCNFNTCQITLAEPPCAIDFNVTYTATSDGILTIRVNPTAGFAPYQLRYTGPTAGGPINNIPAAGQALTPGNFSFGTYTFTLNEQNRPGCTTDFVITLEPPNCSDITISSTLTEPSCEGNNDGSITLSVTGNDNPVITWSTGANGPTINMLTAGTYGYTITDDKGCILIDNLQLTEPDQLELTCSSTDVTTTNGQDGTFTIDITGGTPSYIVSYTAVDPDGNPFFGGTNISVPNTFTFDDLRTGTYTLTLNDSEGCTNSCSVTIDEPAACTIDLTCTAEQPTMVGQDGSVTITFTAPDPNRLFVVIDAATGMEVAGGGGSGDFETTYLIENLPPGTYTVNAADLACTGTCTFTINAVMCTLAVPTPVVNQPSCFEGNDGSITLSPTGATGAITYDWSIDTYDGQPIATNLPAGTYTVTVADEAGCSEPLGPFTLTDPPAIAPVITITDTISCAGGASATLTVTTTGGALPLMYEWSDASFPPMNTATGVSAGMYAVTVTDANGCRDSAQVVVNEPTPFSVVCGASPVSTSGAMDGQVTLTLSGGTPPYSDLLVNGSPTPLPPGNVLTGLAPGPYTIELVDANGCPGSCSATVNEGGCALSVVATATQPDCDMATGTASAQAMDGTGVITYGWSNGATGQMIMSLTPGQYIVTATDEQSCTVMDTVVIDAFTDVPSVAIAGFSPVCGEECSNVELFFTGTADYELFFTITRAGTPVQSSVVRSNVSGPTEFCPGTYGFADFAQTTVTFTEVRDGNGCSRPINEVWQIPHSNTSTGVVTQTLCVGDTLFLENETFQADRTTGTFLSATPNTAGCDSFVQVSIDFFPEASGVVTEQRCPGDSLVVAGEVFNQSRPTGIVVLPGASVNACDSIINVSVTYYAPAVNTQSPILCPGDSLVVGGERFDETRPTGTVVLPGISANGCDSTVTIALTYFAPAASPLDTTLCPGDTLNYFGEQFFAGNTTGDVVLPVQASTGCDSIRQVTLSFFDGASETVNREICSGDSTTVGDQVFTTAVSNAVVRFTNPGTGCDSVVFVNVTLLPAPTLTLSGGTPACAGDSLVTLNLAYTGAEVADVLLISTAGDTVRTTTASQSVNFSFVDGATVTIAEANVSSGCTVTTAGAVGLTLTDLDVAIENTTVPESDCGSAAAGQLASVVTGGLAPYTLQWSTGSDSTALEGLPAGSYSVTVADARGCTDSSTLNLTLAAGLDLLVDTLPATCPDPLATIILRDVNGGSGPYLYRIDDGTFLPANLPDTLRVPAQTTTLTVEDASGCQTMVSYQFTPAEIGELAITPMRAQLALGDSVLLRLQATSGVTSFTLSPSPAPDSTYVGSSIWVQPTSSTDYTVTAVDALGCTTTGRVSLIVDTRAQVFAPTAFSPNGDGRNDRFRLFTGNQVVSVNNLRIFDRWGALVYEQTDPIDPQFDGWGWDGTEPDGERVYNSGVFTFSASITLLSNRTEVISGQFALVR